MSARSRPPSGRNNLKQDTGGGTGSRMVSSNQMTGRLGHPHASPRNYTASPRGRPATAADNRRPASATPLTSTRRPPQPSTSARKSTQQSPTPRLHHNRATERSGIPSSRSNKSDDCMILCTDRTDINTREILTRLRNKHADEQRQKDAEETLLMSEYNAFSRPRPSSAMPLRSAFLDPETNNFYPSKTRSELMQRIKLASMPHPSYDIDGDGWVSQEDYKLAKRFDFDGNGVIDPHERKIAKSVITDEFFKAHRENLHVFGEKIANATHAENVNAVVNSTNFERTFGLLKGVEDSLKGRASKEMLGCMDTVYKNLTKHNFYTNKFDTSAWNDFDAIPRGTPTLEDMNHHGSRRRLMESRKARSRLECNDFNQKAISKDKSFRNHRISLISNFALEN